MSRECYAYIASVCTCRLRTEYCDIILPVQIYSGNWPQSQFCIFFRERIFLK